MDDKYWEDLGVLCGIKSSDFNDYMGKQDLIDLLNKIDMGMVDTKQKRKIFPVVSIIFRKIYGHTDGLMPVFNNDNIYRKRLVYSEIDVNNVLERLNEFQQEEIDVSYFELYDGESMLLHGFCEEYILGLLKKIKR